MRGEAGAGAHFEKGGGVVAEGGDGLGETDGVPGVADPVFGLGEGVVVDELSGDGGDHRQRGG